MQPTIPEIDADRLADAVRMHELDRATSTAFSTCSTSTTCG